MTEDEWNHASDGVRAELVARHDKIRSLEGELRAWREWTFSILQYAVDDGTARERITCRITGDFK